MSCLDNWYPLVVLSVVTRSVSAICEIYVSNLPLCSWVTSKHDHQKMSEPFEEVGESASRRCFWAQNGCMNGYQQHRGKLETLFKQSSMHTDVYFMHPSCKSSQVTMFWQSAWPGVDTELSVQQESAPSGFDLLLLYEKLKTSYS